MNTPHTFILIDSGIMVAFYNRKDRYHQQVVRFFSTCTSQLITTVSCVTEVMWLLAPNISVQNNFLSALEIGVFSAEHLTSEDYQRIRILNSNYQDLPADFTDLSLVAISERLNIPAIATLDKDFDVYRRYRSQPFIRVFYP
ncbi:type II toxin-antitoxin system VapC family toxin [Lusitaniella coriacea LEGE 07157]|uniref:Type II toxin-antitoxin system VapC family toxin n=1 Tax=Lusitaniella coriacea LEGE 07157 TaxID=945747 RepID=A0A8J7IU25_9CYAN|nr:PIN domain-containing protein [Lusitaniella coriacea]MBE9116233.1 type II toxin-antitoxin system VapC family toxin [Lusitaniella coriacea LEGE 07157]